MEGMALDKTPDIDGFPVEFFTKHWTTVKEDVLCAVRKFFTTGKLLKEVSLTAITLVPKKATPTQVADYRPIACYKIITKILTNRIKPIIGSIVSPLSMHL
uniref:BZIP n=1 Tax=Solanum tuberosum TaxID=4113 RepID=M1AUV2_SOLTU